MKHLMIIAILTTLSLSAFAIESDTDCPMISQKRESKEVKKPQPKVEEVKGVRGTGA